MARKHKDSDLGVGIEQHLGANDPLIQALIEKLPDPDSHWPQAERDKWLALFKQAIDIAYGDPSAAPPEATGT